MKKKILKIKIGDAYDAELKKNLPVYATAWADEDGTYTLIQKVYVSEVEVKDKQQAKTKVEA